MAAGLIVSRVGDEKNIGEQMIDQLFARSQALIIAGGVLGVLGLMPGMPHVAFLSFAALCGAGGYWMQRQIAKPREAEVAPVPLAGEAAQEATWDDLVPVDVLALEVGYRLIPLVDRAQDGELLKRIKGIRKKFAQEIGFLPPSVHIRDNLELKPNAYRILVNGVVMGEGEAVPGMYLAINPGNASGTLPGTPTKDPAFGLPASWIESAYRGQAQIAGHTVVDASTVVATHLNTLMQRHASMLLGRQEVQSLLDHFGKSAGKLVEEVFPKVITITVLQKVLQHLLDEGVPVRDLRSIIESIAENAARTQDPGELCTRVRCALGASIVQNLFGGALELPVMVLEPELEKIVHQAIGGGTGLGLEPGLADSLLRDTLNATRRHEALGQPAVLLAPDSLRWPLARLLRRSLPHLRVLAHGEIPDNRSIRVTSVVGAPA
ncbi:MAG: FHIPEP family type III secretion protein, partial [Burkholderiales bacterium]